MLPLTRIVLLALAGASPTHVCRLLEARGLQVTVVTSLPAAGDISTTSTSGMWIAFLEPEQVPGFSHLSVLVQTAHFHGWPLLVVSHDTSLLEVELSRVFPSVGSVTLPCEESLIVDAAMQLWRRSQSDLTIQAPDSPRSSTNLRPLDRSGVSEGSATAEQVSRISLVHNFLKDITRFSESGLDVGGALYARATRIDPFLEYLNTHGISAAEVDTRIGAAVELRVRLHLARTAYITFCLLSAAGIDKSASLRGTRISLLIAKSFSMSRALALNEYLTTTDLASRVSVARAVGKSAQLVSSDPSLATESGVLLNVSRLIQQESLSPASPDTRVAESLFIADLIDRTCFAPGFFSASRASQLLRMIRFGRLPNVQAPLLATTTRFLCEAIVSCPPGMVMPGRIFKEYRKLRQEPVKKVPLLKDEVEVSIQNLTPGMLLTRPLKTLDGASVLETEQRLDADLIWRLWQLTALRPVESAVVRGKRARKSVLG